VVGWNKPTFRGKEALEAERARGVSRRLRGIATEGRRPPREGCAVLIDGEPAGALTSGNFSPVLGHGIGLAFLPPAVGRHAVEVDVRALLTGRVVPLPLSRRAEFGEPGRQRTALAPRWDEQPPPPHARDGRRAHQVAIALPRRSGCIATRSPG
jgi:hypothetical protein